MRARMPFSPAGQPASHPFLATAAKHMRREHKFADSRPLPSRLSALSLPNWLGRNLAGRLSGARWSHMLSGVISARSPSQSQTPLEVLSTTSPYLVVSNQPGHEFNS